MADAWRIPGGRVAACRLIPRVVACIWWTRGGRLEDAWRTRGGRDAWRGLRPVILVFCWSISRVIGGTTAGGRCANRQVIRDALGRAVCHPTDNARVGGLGAEAFILRNQSREKNPPANNSLYRVGGFRIEYKHPQTPAHCFMR